MALKKLHFVVVALATGVALGAAYWLQNRGPSDLARSASSNGANTPATAATGERSGPVAVEVAQVEAADLKDETQAIGTLRSKQGVMLRPEVSGRVKQLGFSDGQAVKRGQILVQLDDALQLAQLQQAQAQAGIAQTQLQRNRELLAQNFVSQSVVDQALANLQVAQAQVALSQAQLARMRVIAPFDGWAGIRLVNVGDYVKDGADLINLEDISSMLVDFRLPERVINRVKTGQSVSVVLDAMPNKKFNGQVLALDSQVEANGRSVLVRAKLPNAQGLLRPGMFARTGIVFSERRGALVVPEEALVPQGGKQFLIKVVNATEPGKLPVSQRLEAKLGLRVPGRVEILDGIELGDQVVTAGQARLMRTDGLPLKVVEVGRGPTGGKRTAASSGAAAGSAASGTGAETPAAAR